MQLTHTGDDGLSALLVGTHGECRVFLGQLCESVVQLRDVGLALRFHCDGNHGVGEGHGFEHDGMGFVAKGVTRADILEADTCADVTGVDRVHGNLLL